MNILFVDDLAHKFMAGRGSDGIDDWVNDVHDHLDYLGREMRLVFLLDQGIGQQHSGAEDTIFVVNLAGARASFLEYCDAIVSDLCLHWDPFTSGTFEHDDSGCVLCEELVEKDRGVRPENPIACLIVSSFHGQNTSGPFESLSKKDPEAIAAWVVRTLEARSRNTVSYIPELGRSLNHLFVRGPINAIFHGDSFYHNPDDTRVELDPTDYSWDSCDRLIQLAEAGIASLPDREMDGPADRALKELLEHIRETAKVINKAKVIRDLNVPDPRDRLSRELQNANRDRREYGGRPEFYRFGGDSEAWSPFLIERAKPTPLIVNADPDELGLVIEPLPKEDFRIRWKAVIPSTIIDEILKNHIDQALPKRFWATVFAGKDVPYLFWVLAHDGVGFPSPDPSDLSLHLDRTPSYREAARLAHVFVASRFRMEPEKFSVFEVLPDKDEEKGVFVRAMPDNELSIAGFHIKWNPRPGTSVLFAFPTHRQGKAAGP